MMPDPTHYFVIEGAGSTFVHPLGMAMLLVCGVFLVVLPRRYALWAFVALLCFVSARQAVAIWGFNLYFPRFMILVFGVVRVLVRNELTTMRLNRLDWLVIAFAILYMLSGAINWNFSDTVLKTRSGYVSEVFGTYFLCRILVRDIEDLRSVAMGLALVSLPLLAFFILENQTGRNVFAVFGGVPEITQERGGRLRCQGAFGHPILAGVFWAALLPLLIAGALEQSRRRWLFVAGGFAATAIVILSASSTPALGLATALVGWACFRLRRYARYAFMALGCMLVFLHLIMKAPVWSLIQRIDVTTGNSGYHRYILVDGFLTHMNEWWAFGSRVGTEHWGHFTFDTANQFVSIGVAGGLATLLVFIAIIVVSMNAAGRMATHHALWGWATGVSVFTLVVCFFGISIWGQLHFAWSLPLAIAGSLGFGSSRQPVLAVARRRPQAGSAPPRFA